MSEWWERPETKPQEPTPDAPVPTEPSVPSEPSVPTPPAPPSPPQTPETPVPPSEPTPPIEPEVPSPPTVTPPTMSTPSSSWTPPTPPRTPNEWPPRVSAPAPRPTPPTKAPGRGASVIAVSILAALCVACVAIIAMLLLDGMPAKLTPNGSTTPSNTVSSAEPGTSVNENAPSVTIHNTEVNDGGLTTTEIVKRNLDSTVVINMYAAKAARYGNFTFNPDGETLAGTASGIVMSEDGYIITNQHVTVDESTGQAYARIEVVLYNGATYTARLIGADEDTDLAVIKIDATGLQPATFGTSSQMSVGDRVVTIGNAGGLEWSASQGILSGTKRDVYEKTGYSIQCLQIDAAINPGNSGGPLINAQGQVIGINSAKIVYSGYESLGFSIPIDEAKPILDDLLSHGYVTGRVELGIKGNTIPYSGYEGFMVQEINEDSSLVGTSVKVNDIIVSLDGEPVTNRTELRNLLSKHKVGDVVTLGILRITDSWTGATESFEVKVTLRESRGQ